MRDLMCRACATMCLAALFAAVPLHADIVEEGAGAELPVPPSRDAPYASGPVVLVGIASYYGPGFHGRRTASGAVFDQEAMTAASNDIALGARIRVTHLGNGRSVILLVNDRMAAEGSRLIDVSRRAAERLGFASAGLARVRVEVLAPGGADDATR